MVVIRIKNLNDISCKVGLLYCFLVVALVKGVEAEAVHRLRIPDSECIDDAVSIADNRQVIGHCLDGLVILLIPDQPAILLTACNISAKLNDLGILRAAKLERIAIPEPVIGNLPLESVPDFLLEHTIAVADAASV